LFLLMGEKLLFKFRNLGNPNFQMKL